MIYDCSDLSRGSYTRSKDDCKISNNSEIEDLSERKLSEEEAQDRVKWRRLI